MKYILLLASLISSIAQAETVKLNPDSLRTLLLENNNSIMVELNQLQQAKDSLSVARGNLLPSINLGAIISTAANPAFIMSSISILLPFLVPSNWFNLAASRHELEAEKASYYLLQLNAYASAYGLYETIVTDMDLLEILQTKYNNLKNIHDTLQTQSDLVGNVSQQDINNAAAQAQIAYVSMLQLDELVNKTEKPSLGRALGLPIATDFVIEPTHVGPSVDETQDLQKIAEKALALAPETIQLKELEAAAKDLKWSKIFSFLTGASLSTSLSSRPGSSFTPINIGTSSNLGFSYGPNVQLSNDSIKQVKLRQEELSLEENFLVESSVGSLHSAAEQLAVSTQAEQSLNDSYALALQQYDLGLTDILHVFTAQNDVTNASVIRVKSQMDLDNQRISLHRMMLTDQFAKISGCHLDAKNLDKGGLFGHLFGHKGSNDVDAACKAKSGS